MRDFFEELKQTLKDNIQNNNIKRSDMQAITEKLAKELLKVAEDKDINFLEDLLKKVTETLTNYMESTEDKNTLVVGARDLRDLKNSLTLFLQGKTMFGIVQDAIKHALDSKSNSVKELKSDLNKALNLSLKPTERRKPEKKEIEESTEPSKETSKQENIDQSKKETKYKAINNKMLLNGYQEAKEKLKTLSKDDTEYNKIYNNIKEMELELASRGKRDKPKVYTEDKPLESEKEYILSSDLDKFKILLRRRVLETNPYEILMIDKDLKNLTKNIVKAQYITNFEDLNNFEQIIKSLEDLLKDENLDKEERQSVTENLDELTIKYDELKSNMKELKIKDIMQKLDENLSKGLEYITYGNEMSANAKVLINEIKQDKTKDQNKIKRLTDYVFRSNQGLIGGYDKLRQILRNKSNLKEEGINVDDIRVYDFENLKKETIELQKKLNVVYNDALKLGIEKGSVNPKGEKGMGAGEFLKKFNINEKLNEYDKSLNKPKVKELIKDPFTGEMKETYVSKPTKEIEKLTPGLYTGIPNPEELEKIYQIKDPRKKRELFHKKQDRKEFNDTLSLIRQMSAEEARKAINETQETKYKNMSIKDIISGSNQLLQNIESGKLDDNPEKLNEALKNIAEMEKEIYRKEIINRMKGKEEPKEEVKTEKDKPKKEEVEKQEEIEKQEEVEKQEEISETQEPVEEETELEDINMDELDELLLDDKEAKEFNLFKKEASLDIKNYLELNK